MPGNVIPFDEAIAGTTLFILYPDTESEISCIWSDLHVDRRTIPAGWFAYDVRGDDDCGELCTVENREVWVNHCATLLAQKEIEFPENRCWLLLDDIDWTFGDRQETKIGEV